ncbi:11363_t:CDS:1, partial [Entrophospora sp. SA101]
MEKKTLVLDLDKTIIFATRKKKLAPESFTITSTTYWNSTEINEIYYVYKRPYLDLFLEK